MSEVLTVSGITNGYLDINTMYEDSGGGGGGGGGATVEPLIVELTSEETDTIIYTLNAGAKLIYDSYISGVPVLIHENTVETENEDEYGRDEYFQLQSVIKDTTNSELEMYYFYASNYTFLSATDNNYPTTADDSSVDDAD